MSDKAKALVWDYYEPRDWGGVPIITVQALADSADDHGAGISAPVSEMAGKTRQADRTVQRHLKLLQKLGLLDLVEATKGGGGREGNTYRLNLASLVSRNEGDRMSPSRVTICHPQTTPKGDTVSPSADALYISSTSNKYIYVEGDSDVTLSEGAEDRRLAVWMFDRLKALKPNFKEPTWQAWCRDIRLMRTRDKRTRREIAKLFAWVNGDPFWQSNVLCPHTLRKQWDRLELQAMKQPGAVAAATPRVDHRCAGPREDERCPGGRQGTSSDGTHPNAPWRCDECREVMERERAMA